MNTAQDNVKDLRVQAGQNALKRIAGRELAAQADAPKCRADWRDVGAALMIGRDSTSGKPAFGKWVRDNGFDYGPLANAQARSEAIWFAENFSTVEKWAAKHVPALNHPTSIRIEFNKAHKAAPAPKVAANEQLPDEPAAPAEPSAKKVGWLDSLLASNHGPLPANASEHLQRAGKRGQGIRDAFIEALGAPPKKLIDHATEGPLYYAAFKTAMAKVKPELVIAPASAPVMTKADKATIETAIKVETARLQSEFKAAVAAEAAKLVPGQLEAQQELSEQMFIWQERNKKFNVWMTQEEFNLVRGCLHPDRAPEDQREKFAKAFQIFNRLAQHVDPDKRKRSQFGWK